MPLPEATTDRAPTPSESGKKAKKSKEEFLRIARKRFDRAMTAESKNRLMAIEDLKFKSGEQWPESIKADRTSEKRPCLTINKMKTFVHQVTNDQRQNRPQINVSPVGDKSDPNTAKMLKGLIRQIERQSNADVAYDTGFDSAVSNGWGYWRVLTEYEGEDSFDQVIRIGRIRNPFRVYLDPDHQEPDGSDAKWGFISDLIPRTEFEESYPKADAIAWDQGAMGDEYKNWNTQSHVRIAEYFYFETKTRKLVQLLNGHVGFDDELAESIKEEIAANPDMVAETREVSARMLKWCKLTAKDILEENEWPGKWIPLVKVIGDEVDVEGKVQLAGLIRDAKDAQRMYNYWVTSETELISLAPKAPWLMEEGQVEGHEQRWKSANQKSYPYLLYKGTSISGKPAPPPQRQQFAGPPSGIVQAKISAAQDMQATTGIRFDATLQERTYDESGRALRELKRVGDLGNFHYIDNLARSLRHTGRILIDLIPKIYDTHRVLTILREDDSEERIQIEPSLGTPHSEKQGPDGRVQKLYNPKLGNYEVVVTIGPSFATKRAEAADSMLQFMKVVPQAAQIVGDLIAKNMDWPGAEEISSRLASMLPPQLLQQGKMKDLPPEAQAMINSLSTQLQQVSGQHKQAVAMLGDQDKDRQLDKYGIDKDYEAKIAKIMAQMEEKTARTLAEAVKSYEDKFKEIDHRMQLERANNATVDMKRAAVNGHDPRIDQVIESLKDVRKQMANPKKRKIKFKGRDGTTKVAEIE